MRITIGRFKRRYLYDCRLGCRRVVKKMKGGVQIWPTLPDLVRYAVLDVSPLEGTLEGAYWAHALDAVRSQSSESRYMRLQAGGKSYHLLTSFGQYDVAGYDHATLDFGDHGPLASRFGVGDEVEVRVQVPQREWPHLAYGYWGASSMQYDVPFIPGMAVRVRVQKGRKKVSAGVSFWLRGVGSNAAHIVGNAQKNGHCRGQYWGTAYAGPGWVIDGCVQSFSNHYVPGDSGLSLGFQGYFGGEGEGFLVSPKFARVFRLKVVDVVRHG